MTVESSAKSNFLSIKNLTHFFPYHVALNQKSTLLVWQKKWSVFRVRGSTSLGSCNTSGHPPALWYVGCSIQGTSGLPKTSTSFGSMGSSWYHWAWIWMVNPDLRSFIAAPKQSGLSQQCRSPNKKGLVCGIHFHRNCQPAFGTSFFKKMLKKSHHNASETPKSVSAVDCLDNVRVSASPNL